MATELDRKLEEAYQIVTGPGGQIEVGEVDYHGHKVPIITNAPPSLPFYFAHFCAQHGDAIFLVDGDERLSFADTYTAARAVAGVGKGDHQMAFAWKRSCILSAPISRPFSSTGSASTI